MEHMTRQTTWDPSTSHLEILKSAEAKRHYRYASVERLLNNTEDLLEMVHHHREQQVPRLVILYHYYINENVGIHRRPKRPNPKKSDVRIAHSFAQYITDFFTGYMLGIPVNVEYDDEKVNDALKVFQKDNDVDALNTELERSLSIYGRAYEIQYRNNDDVDVVKQVSVMNTFMVYDKTIENNELFGVYYVEEDGVFTIEIHTSDEVIYFNDVESRDKTLTIANREYHDREEVDITEYTNDPHRLGDYERQIGDIDAYDFVQSDLANFMNDNNEAKLVVKGDPSDEMMESDEGDVAVGMKESDVMMVQGSMDVSYLTRTYDVEVNNSYTKRLESDIHKFSYAPNFNDEFFSNNSSGVAIENKFYLSNQKVKIKEHLFEKALRKRYRMWARFKEWQEELTGYDPRKLTITLHSNLPVSFKDEIEAHIKAGGKLSQETLLGELKIVKNVSEEQARIERENEARRGTLYDYQVPAAQRTDGDQ